MTFKDSNAPFSVPDVRARPSSSLQRRQTSAQSLLQSKLRSKEAVIGIVGLGYVGLPLAVAYASEQVRSIGFDLSADKVDMINDGRNYIQDVNTGDLAAAVESKLLSATASFEEAAQCDVIYIAVPTPVTAHKDPDVSYIEGAARAIAAHLRAGQLIILKSTTYPNTTEGVVQPILEEAARAKGLTLGKDYFLAFSPERIDPGNMQFTTQNTPVVVGGVTPECTDLAAAALELIIPNVHQVSSPRVAEMEKLLENIFRSVNIALVNELARLCDRMGGVSMWEVVEAAATKPFGFMPFYPGPGLGGHCIPIDPYYLSWLARAYDFETSFITLAARTNEEMPFYVEQTVTKAIANQPVRLKDAKVLILGVSFKRDVDDTRHSPSEKVMQILCDKGICDISYSDPHVPRFEVELGGVAQKLESIPLTNESIEAFDVVVLMTDHKAFDYEMIAESAKAIVDTRNAFKDVSCDPHKLYLLGGGGF